MALTAAQERYLDKLDPEDVAEYIRPHFEENWYPASEFDQMSTALESVTAMIYRHHSFEHPGPIVMCPHEVCDFTARCNL